MPADIQHKEEFTQLSPAMQLVYRIDNAPTYDLGAYNGRRSDCISWLVNSGDSYNGILDLLESNSFHLNENRQFIKLTEEYKQLSEKFDFLQRNDFSNQANEISAYIVRLQADRVSLQASFDNSILYGIVKGGVKIYIQFFSDISEGTDEVVFSITNNGNIILSFGGTWVEAKYEIDNFFNPPYNSNRKGQNFHAISS
jgi:hypothetical protein